MAYHKMAFRAGESIAYDKIILGEGAVYSTDSRVTQLNNNVLVCGGSGCGKTMSLSEPKLLCTKNASLVLTLSKRKLVKTYRKLFQKRNYHVLDMNFVSPEDSQASYDPLQYVKGWMDVTYLSQAIVMADPHKKDAKVDPYWDNSADFLCHDDREEWHNGGCGGAVPQPAASGR